MNFNNLSEDDKNFILSLYRTNNSRKSIQEQISNHFDVSERTVRRWAHVLGVGLIESNIHSNNKILIYDIETSRVMADVWWAGKQYVSYKQLRSEPKMITVAWKWFLDDKIEYLTWDKNQCDKSMVEEFLNVYNSADLVIGQNNNNFDNRWINARAFKYNLDVNTFVKSFDIMKKAKKLFRLPSYSMDYMTKFLGITNKQSHEGILMWEKIQYGTNEEREEYLKKMIDYNIGDIVSTEEMYLKIRKYATNEMHFGTFNGGEKYDCPICGGSNVHLYKPTNTTAGTLQMIMECKDDNHKFKISYSSYKKFLEEKYIK